MPDRIARASKVLDKRSTAPLTLREKVKHYSLCALLVPVAFAWVLFWCVPADLYRSAICWFATSKKRSIPALVAELVDYENSWHAGKILAPLEETIGQTDLHLICRRLNEWLQHEVKWGKWMRLGGSPLQFPGDYPWCKVLKRLVSEHPDFAAIFKPGDTSISFLEEVSWQERLEIGLFVRKNLKPPMLFD